ncbi:hypothetical protein D3C84_772110 [compost metagenome]
MTAGIAQVNAVQAQQGKPGRVGFGGSPMMTLEGFVQVVAPGQGEVALKLPVIEIAGDDHRRIARQRLKQLAEQGQLQLTVAFPQAQVHTDRMHLGVPRDIEHAMQQPATFGAGDGYIQIAVMTDRVAGQQGIAVMTIGVDRVASVGKVAPHAVGEKLVLRGRWPVVVARRVAIMLAQHLLQEHKVGGGTAHCLTQFWQDEPPVEGGKPLVGVDGQHPEPMGRRRGRRGRLLF